MQMQPFCGWRDLCAAGVDVVPCRFNEDEDTGIVYTGIPGYGAYPLYV
jgi:hypothetical protein